MERTEREGQTEKESLTEKENHRERIRESAGEQRGERGQSRKRENQRVSMINLDLEFLDFIITTSTSDEECV